MDSSLSPGDSSIKDSRQQRGRAVKFSQVTFFGFCRILADFGAKIWTMYQSAYIHNG